MKAANIRPITDLKNRTKEIVREVSEGGQSVVITQNGKAKVVMIVDENRPHVLERRGSPPRQGGARQGVESVSPRRCAVVWTEVALRDVESIVTYLDAEASGRAESVVERIIARGEALETVPERGRTPPELRVVNDRSWREVRESPWRLLHRISGKTVEIHGVLDGRRSLEDILMERLLQS